MGTQDSHRIEVVRGRLEGERAEQVMRFWAEGVGFDEAAAQKRLPQVVCVLVDGDDQVVGVNSVFGAPVPMLADRTLWIYRTLTTPEIEAETGSRMVTAAFEALEREFTEGGGPIGLCLQIPDPSIFPDHKQAYWADTGLIYAGYLDDGRQLRVRYFEGARI